jgi:glycosyltransferase involved in cell wall biosynthesis
MQAVAQRGYTADYNRRGAPLFPASLSEAHVVHIHRYLGSEVLSVVRHLRSAGVGVVWDNDDDLANVPRSNPHYAQFGGSRRTGVERALRAMLRNVDVVTTPSERLAASFRAAGAPDVRVIENFVPDTFPGTRAPRGAGVTVAWLAGLEHQVDYQRTRLRETLLQLLDVHQDLRVLSIGLGLGLNADRYEHISLVEFLDLPSVLARADIGIAPLVEMPWNAARSNVKLKEYASAGLAWLASPVGAYVGMGESEGGRLVPDDSWYEALDRMIVDARTRRKLAKRASKWAKGQTISKNVTSWEAVYRDAHARGSARRT